MKTVATFNLSHDQTCVCLLNGTHVKSLNFELGALGYHHASNCLTVLGTIVDFNLNLDRAINLLKNWQPMPGRGEFRDIKIKRNSESILIRVIDESYNCNPASLKASLEAVKNLSFQDLATKNDGHFRRIAVLGDSFAEARSIALEKTFWFACYQYLWW